MRAVRAFLIVVIALFLAAAVTGAQANARQAEPTATPDEACAFPDELATREARSEAAAQYLELLKATPGLPCAQDGYVQSVAPAATTEPKPTLTPFAAAHALDDQGFASDAQDAYKEAVKANPLETPPAALAHLDGKPNGFTQRVGQIGDLQDEIIGLLTVLVAAIVTTLLLFGILRAIVNWAKDGPPELDIVPFEMSAAGGSIGDAMAESAQAIYTQINKDKPVTLGKIVISAEAETKTAIPAELTKGSAGVVLSLYDWFNGHLRKTYRFTGSAIMDPAKGAGLVLMLQHKNAVKKTETIWFKTFFGKVSTGPVDKAPTAQDFLSLAETAGIVLHHWMTEINKSKPQSKEASHYHTTWRNWESFARFRNSITALGWDDREQAIALLEDSLFYDRWFLPARMNLATLKFQAVLENNSATPLNLSESCERYKDALADLYMRSHARPGDITLRMRLLYNYLAAIDYCVGWNSATFPEEFNRPHLELRRFVASLSRGETWGDTRLNQAEDRQRIAEPLDLLSKTMMIRADDFAQPDEAYPAALSRSMVMTNYLNVSATTVPPAISFGYIARYGNACLCAAAFHRTRDSRWAELGLNHLKEAVQLKSSIKTWARVDPSLEPFRISNETSGKFFDLVHEPDPEPKKTERTEHVLIFDNKGEGDDARNVLRVQTSESSA